MRPLASSSAMYRCTVSGCSRADGMLEVADLRGDWCWKPPSKFEASMLIGVAVHFALIKRLTCILPKALVGVVKYG